MKGNEPDQSNQPPYRAIQKPPPWPLLKVKITVFLVTIWKIWTHRYQVRTNQPCCSPNQLANMAKELLTKFQVVQQPSLPQSTPIRVLWRAPILNIVKVNFDCALFSREQRSGLGVIMARCFSKLHYSYVKRDGNMVAHVFAHLALNVSNYSVWLEDTPPQFYSCVFANFDSICGPVRGRSLSEEATWLRQSTLSLITRNKEKRSEEEFLLGH